MKTCHVSCYYCHTVNKIRICTAFYDVKAIYRCGNCNKLILVHLQQMLYTFDNDNDYQIGEIEE